jgi:hypothetical protein
MKNDRTLTRMPKVKTLFFLIALVAQTFILTSPAQAAGLFRSIRQPAPAPSPTPTPPPTTLPGDGGGDVVDRPTPTPRDPGDLDIFNDVAYLIGGHVDDYYSAHRQLLPIRSDAGAHSVDYCRENLDGQGSFADRIAYFVNLHTENSRAHLAQLASFYNIPSNLNSHAETSLISHRMCRVTAQTLTHTLGSSSRVPSQAVIDRLNQFADRYNRLREGILRGDEEAELEMNQLWTQFMGCLAYTESLTTADIPSSQNVATKYAPSGYRKPAGVKFYEDPWQNEASRLNIGLFQFTPTGSGNINPCIRHWNEQNPTCTISTGASRAELIRVVGSSFQTFNAFCGVNKIQQTFSVQVNTTSTSSTHPENFSGGMKAAANRCVTPFFLAGRAYNHFGPLMNSTGSNLNSLMVCALRQL